MSGKVSGWVWDQDLPQNEKFILLAYADHADHEGNNIFPSIELIAKKTGYSRRNVQRIIRKLEDRKMLIPEGITDKGTHKYKIPVDYDGGDNLSRGDIAVSRGGVTPVSRGGDTAMSPEPSLTVKKQPSINNGRVFAHYQDNIGLITPVIKDLLIDAENEYPEEWIIEAIDIAVKNNARKWSYVDGILKRWKSSGKDSKKPRRDKRGMFPERNTPEAMKKFKEWEQ